MAKKTNAFDVVEIKLQIPIDAPPKKVWTAIVNDTTKWWSRDFYAGANAKSFHFEAKLGGRVYEDWGNGDGLVWFDVIGVKKNEMLLLRGHLTPQFGGPAQSFLELKLEARGASATTLHLHDTTYGRVTAQTKASLETGWRALFEQALKTFVEK